MQRTKIDSESRRMLQRFIYIFICLLFIHFLRNIRCCTPAYEGDRTRLKQHLGIEADPTALDKTAFSDNYIKKSSDLDCNFEGLCRWKNVISDNKSDFFDYYYFSKIENKVWPIQIKPANNPEVGNHLILSGGKNYKPEQDAIWISSPIRCQMNTGLLTFSYWIYNDGKLQTVLYKAKSNPLQKLSSPKLSPTECTGTGKRGIPCTVTIPPVKEHFQIGIRGYDFKKEGFVAIDNIKYEADICSRVQLQDKLSSNALESGLTGKLIYDGKQIHCSTWNKSCRWGNSPNNSHQWQQSSGPIDEAFWRDNFGVNDTPSPPFAIIRSDSSDSSTDAIIFTDPMPCQYSDGTLKLKYWTIGYIQLQVCTLDVQTNAEVTPCQTLNRTLSSDPTQILIKGPIYNPFRIAINAYDFTADQDSYAVIDDVLYEAKLCLDGEIGIVNSSPFTSSNDTSEFAKFSGESNCNFESVCNWYNIKGDDFAWELTKSQPVLTLWQNATGSSTVPNENYATIPPQTMRHIGLAYLVSKPYYCQNGEGSVTFDFWTSQDSALEMCVLKHGSTNTLYCGQTLIGGPGPQTITIPPIDEPYQLSFKGVSINANPNFVAIDNIIYNASVCSNAPSFDAQTCKLLKCDFTLGLPCNWNINLNILPQNEKFQFFNSSIGAAGNVEVKPTQVGKYFLGVLLKNQDKMSAYIESPEFNVKENRKCKISFKRGTFGSTIYVCRNKFDSDLNSFNCQKIAGPDLTLDDFKGSAASLVDIGPADHKLYIIAKHADLKFGPAAIGLDSVDLLDTNGNQVCITQ